MPNAQPLSAAEQAIAVIDAIPTDNKQDWQHLKPDQHAKGLPPEAGPLRRIIESDAVKRLVDERRTAARGASSAQARARLLFHLAILPIALAAAGGLMFVMGYLGLSDQQEAIVYNVIRVCFLVGCVATLYAFFKSIGEWRKSTRHTAETLRRDIFTAITKPAEAAHAGEISPLLLQLEYFRRFQLNAQIDYYTTRIREQGERSERANYWRTAGFILLGLLLVVLALMTVAAAGEQGRISWLAGFTGWLGKLEAKSVDTWILAGLLASIAIYTFSWLSMIQLGDHRALYGDALSSLVNARNTELEAARIAAARGEREPMQKMVKRVHAAMEREHRMWLGM